MNRNKYPSYLIHYGRSINDGAPGVGTGNWRRGATISKIKELNESLNNEWDYGVYHNGKHIIDTSNFDWNKNYRTTPVNILEKEKIGVCWDFVNYQHHKLKNLGIPDKSYMLFIQRSDDPEDAVTHTFTTFELGDKQYWLESAAWPKRGIHEIDGWEDAVKELNEMYKNSDYGYSLFEYNPEGLDKGLTSDEFANRVMVAKNLIYNEPRKK